MLRPLLLFFCAALLLPMAAQQQLDLRAESDGNNVLVRGYASVDDLHPALQALWRFPTDGAPSFSYQRLSAPTGDRSLMLRQLLLSGIEQYLNERIHFAKGGVRAGLSDERMMADLNALVSTATAQFEMGEAFSGFTEPTFEQLERVTHIDWSKADLRADQGDEQDKYLAIYFYVRSQRQELQRQFRADLLPLASVDIHQPTERTDAFSEGRTVAVPTVCSTVYDDKNFLCALDLALADSSQGMMDSPLTDEVMLRIADQAKRMVSDTPEPTTTITNHKIRKRDRWLKAELDAINIRIDDLDQRKELWRLRDRMDDIEGRLDDLGLEVADLRERQEAPSDNPLANLSDLTGTNVIIRFARNSNAVDDEYRIVLNEVFEQLARSPQDRVLITGYTDRSGDPDVNIWLSEQRAKAVRGYLLSRGIPAERLLVNYYGDSRSSGRNPDERRVEVEWLR